LLRLNSVTPAGGWTVFTLAGGEQSAKNPNFVELAGNQRQG